MELTITQTLLRNVPLFLGGVAGVAATYGSLAFTAGFFFLANIIQALIIKRERQ